MEGTITFGTAPKRGRDVRKMDKPYTGREVVHTCSNGWTIERVIPEEFQMEGFFMGHCLGEGSGACIGSEVFSLRESDGTPHATIVDGVMTGRCNQAPKPMYAALCREFDGSWENFVPTDYATEWAEKNRPGVEPEA